MNLAKDLNELRARITAATEQCRKGNDNSPSLFHPDQGFVEACPVDAINQALTDFEAKYSDLRAAG